MLIRPTMRPAPGSRFRMLPRSRRRLSPPVIEFSHPGAGPDGQYTFSASCPLSVR